MIDPDYIRALPNALVSHMYSTSYSTKRLHVLLDLLRANPIIMYLRLSYPDVRPIINLSVSQKTYIRYTYQFQLDELKIEQKTNENSPVAPIYYFRLIFTTDQGDGAQCFRSNDIVQL